MQTECLVFYKHFAQRNCSHQNTQIHGSSMNSFSATFVSTQFNQSSIFSIGMHSRAVSHRTHSLRSNHSEQKNEGATCRCVLAAPTTHFRLVCWVECWRILVQLLRFVSAWGSHGTNNTVFARVYAMEYNRARVCVGAHWRNLARRTHVEVNVTHILANGISCVNQCEMQQAKYMDAKITQTTQTASMRSISFWRSARWACMRMDGTCAVSGMLQQAITLVSRIPHAALCSARDTDKREFKQQSTRPFGIVCRLAYILGDGEQMRGSVLLTKRAHCCWRATQQGQKLNAYVHEACLHVPCTRSSLTVQWQRVCFHLEGEMVNFLFDKNTEDWIDFLIWVIL